MISVLSVLVILAIHYVGDFIFQTEWQARNKSKNNAALTSHVGTYTMTWIVPMLIMFSTSAHVLTAFFLAILFAGITFVCHWTTDYFTSRINAKLWAKGNTHGFFVSLGFDQLLHFTQLLLTFVLLKSL